MYSINKITSNTTVDFAAEELKKYLKMMMPRCGEISIKYDPDAADGYRLGLMSDFDIDTSEAEDLRLDDIIHIDTDENGGIIAGSNPRSVLFAVYRFLKENGCKWLMPGIDGEFVPIADVKPTKYHKMADKRYRGQCNEGCEAQQNMIDTIEFTPKLEMNIYMMEFDVPFNYYNKWYAHNYNKNIKPETVDYDTVLQWKRACEAEISKRGLEFHDMGHGWNAEPFGINSKHGWVADCDDVNVPEESVQFLAMIDGKRGLRRGVPLNTNICLSNPKARQIMVQYIADYAQTQNNVDFLHVWLADGRNNHCECENCVKKHPSDFYIMMLNELDEELTKRNLDTHIVFIAYVDTIWPPIDQKFNNLKRFTMLFAPISRLYTETYAETPDKSMIEPFNRNHLHHPEGMAANLAYLEEWKKTYKGDCFCYEYHFWRQQYFDPGVFTFAKTLYNDITSLDKCELLGIVEDGSQRSYFPNGFLMYLYGTLLFDNSVPFDKIVEDYFSTAYGKDWEKVVEYLKELSDLFDFAYINGKKSTNLNRGSFYNPMRSKELKKAEELINEFAAVIEENIVQPKRTVSVHWQLLEFHAKYCKLLANALKLKASGLQEEAHAAFKSMLLELGKFEEKWQKYYDQGLLGASYMLVFKVTEEVAEIVTEL